MAFDSGHPWSALRLSDEILRAAGRIHLWRGK